MLVITANWSIPDGTLYGPLSWGRAQHFFLALHRAALRFGFRHDGTYHPVEQIDLVFAGDTGDWLVSSEWTEKMRPWHRSSRTTEIVHRVAAGSLRCGARFFARLSQLVRDGVGVPQADSRGRPVLQSSKRASVRVTLLSGDRDRWLEHPAFASLATRHALSVGAQWSNQSVVACHGDAFDPLGSSWQCDQDPHGASGHIASALDRPPSLSESLAVDLLARFGRAICEQGQLRSRVSSLLRRLATGWPLDMPTHIGAWLMANKVSAEPDHTARQVLVEAWRRAVGHWHREARRVVPESFMQCDSIDRLAGWLETVEEHTQESRRGGCADAFLMSTGLSLEQTGLSYAAAPTQMQVPRAVVLGHPPAHLSTVAKQGQHTTVCLGPALLPQSVLSPVLDSSGCVDVSFITPRSASQRACIPVAIALLDNGKDGPADRIVFPDERYRE